MRLHPAVIKGLVHAVSGQERLALNNLLADLSKRLGKQGLVPPSRATVYHFLKSAPTPSYAIRTLPIAAQQALYNLDADGCVPGRQLAFYCFNYGSIQAVMFAAGLPWLALYQAARMAGLRPRSRGLLEAVLRARKI